MEVDANYGGTGGSYDTTWVVGTGSVESWGTYDMGGNAFEWIEDLPSGAGSASRIVRGGSYTSPNETNLSISTRVTLNNAGYTAAGFRVVEVIPEPATLGLISICAASLLFFRRVVSY